MELDALSDHAGLAPLQAYAFGGNEYAQATGRGGRDVVTPQPCLPRLRVAQVAAGGMHSVALTDSGEVRLKPPRPSLGLGPCQLTPAALDVSGDARTPRSSGAEQLTLVQRRLYREAGGVGGGRCGRGASRGGTSPWTSTGAPARWRGPPALLRSPAAPSTTCCSPGALRSSPTAVVRCHQKSSACKLAVQCLVPAEHLLRGDCDVMLHFLPLGAAPLELLGMQHEGCCIRERTAKRQQGLDLLCVPLVRRRTGEVFAWGINDFGQVRCMAFPSLFVPAVPRA